MATVLETPSSSTSIGFLGTASRRAVVVLVLVALFDLSYLDYTVLDILNECYHLLTVRRERIPA